ncbi:MAG: periplasmic heavy metal sensor [bacterium]
MRGKLFILAFVLSVALNLGFLGMMVRHHWQPPPPPPFKDKFCPFYKERFGLSKEKSVRIEALRRTMMSEMKPIRNELKRKGKELIRLLLEPRVNQKEIDEKLKNIQALEGKIQSKLVKHLCEVKSELTPEEQKRFFKFIMQRMEHRQGDWMRRKMMKKGVMKDSQK